MKRLCLLLAVCVLLCSSFAVFPAAAAHSDFDIRSGVLVNYSGSETDVTVPDGVIAVGDSAFLNNTAVTGVKLPSSVVAVGEQAFYGCSSLKSVSGGDNVSQVGDLAFYGTPYLDNSTDKYFMLGNVLLWYNGTSESVSIPTRCTAVASYAFLKCEYLTSFTAYEGLISVGTGAFYGCTRLSAVSLPSTVSEIGAYAFEGTPYLRRLGAFAVAGDGVLMRYQGSDTQVTVPDGVRRIAPHAFTSSKLTAVDLPTSVYAVDACAFADCVGLSGLNLSDGLVTVGDGAFRGCKSLKSLTTPTTLSYIGQSAFEGSTALNGVALKGDDLTVSYSAFKGCTGLQYALLSADVTSVYANAFDGCTKLEGISFSADTQEISPAALSGCNSVTVCCEQNAPAGSVLSAYDINTVIGDADGDQSLTIIDATMIQCHMAKLTRMDGACYASSDVNFDGEVNILDSLYIQMWVAGLDEPLS